MNLRKHLRLLGIVTAAWLLFWVAGLPDYYQQYSTQAMVVFDFAVLPPLWFATYWSVRKSRNRFANSLWLAFYFTVPLFFYDYLFCGVYLRHGLAFLWDYWYLTVYYILPWLILPLTGWRLSKSINIEVNNAH
jgi:hypothetical protein